MRCWLAHLLVEALPEDVDVVGLSPLAPLGASSALAAVHQDRLVSTVRGTKVVSDPTNVLAPEVAVPDYYNELPAQDTSRGCPYMPRALTQ